MLEKVSQNHKTYLLDLQLFCWRHFSKTEVMQNTDLNILVIKYGKYPFFIYFPFSDTIASDFLNIRRPESKNRELRIPYMVNYLLDELPIMLSGVKHEGIHYKTILYPTGKYIYIR